MAMSEIESAVSGRVTLQKVLGTLTFEELLNALQQFYAGTPTPDVVWDLSAASLEQLRFPDLERLAEFVMQYASKRTGGKTAIVAPDDLGFGIGRVIGSLAESKDSPIATHTFRQLTDAFKWIGVDALPSFYETQ